MSDNNAKKKLKLDAEVLAGIFSPIRSNMGIPNYYPTDYEFTKYKVRIDWEDNLREGVTIGPGDPDFSFDGNTGELLYKGIKVLLYIRDQINYHLQNIQLFYLYYQNILNIVFLQLGLEIIL